MQVHCRFIAGSFGMDLYGSIWIYESRKIKPSRNIAKLLQVPGRYESVLGGLSFSPASLRFDASFPGQVPEIELEKSGHVKLQVSKMQIFITLLLQLSSLFAPSISFSSFSISSCIDPGVCIQGFESLPPSSLRSRAVSLLRGQPLSSLCSSMQAGHGRTTEISWEDLRRASCFANSSIWYGNLWHSLAMYMAQNASIFRECMNAGMDVLWAY